MGKDRVLSIIGATRCNLNCSYCFLHKNPAYIEEDAKVIAALKDGSYIRNIKTTLNKLKIPYDDFSKFEIWGAETSLHMSESEDFFKELLRSFPNITEIGYSSNFLTDVQNHLDLINILEQYGPRDRYVLPIQISVDGPDWILSQTRHYKYQALKNNVLKFIDALNKTKLKKCHIDLNYKATLPWEVFEKIISSKESMEEYYDFWLAEEEDIGNKVINGNVHFKVHNGYVPALVWPYQYVKEDGLKITAAAQLIDANRLYKKYHLDRNMILEIFGFDEVERNYDPIGGCGKYVYSLMFKPDGSMAACSNGILDTNDKNLEWLKENDPKEYEESLRTRPYSDTYDENGNVDYNKMKKHFDYMSRFWEYQTNYVLTNICAQIYELSYAGLISDSYKRDPEMIYRHALYILRKHGCYFTNLRATGSPYVPDRSYLILVCNGLLEYYEAKKRSL